MMNRRLLRAPLLLALPLAFIVGACTEDIESGAACPTLCPGQQLDIIDTVISPAVVLDTTIGDFPLLGFEPFLLLASRGDTLDVRGIIRFDTLVRFFKPNDTTDAIPVTSVDSATLNIFLRRTSLPLPAIFTIEAFDVGDPSLPDLDPATLAPFFTPDRRVGSVKLDSADVKDSTVVKIPLDTAMLRAIIADPAKVMRFGLMIRATGGGEVHVVTSTDAVQSPVLRYRVSPDTSVSVAEIRPRSGTPKTPQFVAGFLEDYNFVADSRDIARANTFAVGGMPGVRSYLRFELPTWLTDSVAIVQASLELVQDPLRGLDDTVAVPIYGQMVLAGEEVTDLRRAMSLVAPIGAFITDELVVAPGDSGVVSLEINALIRQWRTVDGEPRLPSALTLRSRFEGSSGFAARFFDMNAAPELRPRLRVSYVPSVRFGRP